MARKRNADIELKKERNEREFWQTEKGQAKCKALKPDEMITKAVERGEQIAAAFENSENTTYDIMKMIGDGLTPKETLFFYLSLRRTWLEKSKGKPKAKPQEAKRQQIYNDYLDAWYRKPYQQAKKVADQIAHRYNVRDNTVQKIVSKERIERGLQRLDAKRLVPR
jgi:hypothetical protein